MERQRQREQRERGESGVFVGRLTTPHDLIVMLKTAGEAGRRVGGQDASQRILQRYETEGGTQSRAAQPTVRAFSKSVSPASSCEDAHVYRPYSKASSKLDKVFNLTLNAQVTD